jgi:hypothetical protein
MTGLSFLALALLLETNTLAASVPRIQEAVAEIRGLEFERPVAVKVVTSAEARAHFAARAELLWPRERVAIDQAVYANLGLLPTGFDLLGSFLDVLEEQAQGYYDPGSRTFFLVDTAAEQDTTPMLIAHELTHALDDQHYGLDTLLTAAQDDDDRSAALSALIEGSGTAVMTVFLGRELQAGHITLLALQGLQKTEAARAARLKATPAVIQRGLLSSYILGLSFLLRGDASRLRAGLDAADLSAAFADPPRSTEQILHPEKYWNPAKRDDPWTVTLPDISARLGAGWSLAARGTLGELVLASITGAPPLDPGSAATLSPRSWTTVAAAGIGGDAYHHYVKASKSLTVVATAWDTEHDAIEFQGGLVTVPKRRSFRFGNKVVVLAGEDLGSRTEALAAAVLSGVSATIPAARP